VREVICTVIKESGTIEDDDKVSVSYPNLLNNYLLCKKKYKKKHAHSKGCVLTVSCLW